MLILNRLVKPQRKEVSSFTCEPKLLKEFTDAVPRSRKSETIENLIIQFLKEKSPEKASILSQAKQKDQATKQGDSKDD